ncbi:pH-response transcription factor [Ceratobasidium sp. AG-Ba]|nr:pH-response transcription factor [Ceratobasidium sp. AG-Ba]
MDGDANESEDERADGLDDDDDEEEEEEDMRMLRRRLREHRCKWRGCVGPPVLASTELLGVHLNKKHGPRRDASGHYTCRWGDCRMQYRRGKDLWEHVSEEHIIKPLWCPYQNCARAATDRYQLDIHIRRKHRGRADQELRPLARPEECAPSQQMLRPEAFPADVPFYRLMGMLLRYNILPASVSAQWHAKNGPKILRKISAEMSPARPTTPFIHSQTPRPSTSEAGGNLPAFGSPVAVARPYPRQQRTRLASEVVYFSALGRRDSRAADTDATKGETKRKTARRAWSGSSERKGKGTRRKFCGKSGKHEAADFSTTGGDVRIGCTRCATDASIGFNSTSGVDVIQGYARLVQAAAADGGRAPEPGAEAAEVNRLVIFFSHFDAI